MPDRYGALKMCLTMLVNGLLLLSDDPKWSIEPNVCAFVKDVASLTHP